MRWVVVIIADGQLEEHIDFDEMPSIKVPGEQDGYFQINSSSLGMAIRAKGIQRITAVEVPHDA